MVFARLIGHNLERSLAGCVRPATLRWMIVTFGVVVAIIYSLRR
jgi:hypothetical protein